MIFVEFVHVKMVIQGCSIVMVVQYAGDNMLT